MKTSTCLYIHTLEFWEISALLSNHICAYHFLPTASNKNEIDLMRYIQKQRHILTHIRYN